MRRRGRASACCAFAAGTLVSLLQPFAPHVAEELWERLGGERLWREPWPVADERLLERDTFKLVVQVNGKLRGRVEAGPRPDRDASCWPPRGRCPTCARTSTARGRASEIVVPDKLVNIVVK